MDDVKAHDEAPRKEGTFRKLLDAAPDAILLVDQRGRIILANAQSREMFGYGPEELLGASIEVLVPESARSHHVDMRQEYMKQPRTRPMGIGLELNAARKDGSLMPVEISLSPFDFEGLPCTIAIVRDVTILRRINRELKKTNDELKRSNEELEQFAYVASHDLQEPLRMVGGYTQLLKRRYSGKLDSDADEFIDYAVDGVKRMQDLISDLLTFSRVSTRGSAFETVDVQDLLRQVLANLEVSIDEAGAQITHDPLPNVKGDRIQIGQVIQNLIGNGIKFRRAEIPAQVHILATEEDAMWRFSVADNGIGIDAAYREKIFVIFQRLHTRNKYPGTGIGLALCKKIVERHGGRIWLDSIPGRGSTFHFTLPKAQ